jgi:hypothetical protein
VPPRRRSATMRLNLNVRDALRLVAAILLALAGCRPPAPAAHAQAEVGRGAAGFQDTGDAGDDPWVAGCHWQFTDSQCTTGKMFMQGDSCKDSTHLIEWTDTKCHTLTDSVKHDCDAECRAQGQGRGRCVKVEDACGKDLHSARCECVEA